jgi:dihydrolipoamide dehydrogenase
MDQIYDVVVVGAGPGGYVGAIRAAQLGMKTAVVEAEKVGGVCVNWGCIPSKALLHCAEIHDLAAARGRADCGIRADSLPFDYAAIVDKSRRAAERLSRAIEGLFRNLKIDVLYGAGRLADGQTVLVTRPGQSTADLQVRGRRILLATGARPRQLPGLHMDGQRVMTSWQALNLREVPRSIAIIGGGAVGVEFASIYASYGSKVTVVEAEGQAPPYVDEELAKELERCLARRGIRFLLGVHCRDVRVTPNGVEAFVFSSNQEWRLEDERMLVAIGVSPNSENLGLEELAIETQRGFVQTKPGYRTACETVWAVGDLTGLPLLAHAASAEAILAVESMAGLGDRTINRQAMPACIYTQPELGTVGWSEKQAREKKSDVGVVKVLFAANGKAVATGQTDGFIKLIFDKETHAILGCHIIGDSTTELINQMSLAMSANLTVEQVASAIYAHPTRAEIIGEVAHAALGRAVGEM